MQAMGAEPNDERLDARPIVLRLSLATAIGWLVFAGLHAASGRGAVALVHVLAFIPSALGFALARANRAGHALPLVMGGSIVGLATVATMTGGTTSPAMAFVGLVTLVGGLLPRLASRIACLSASLVAIGAVGVVTPMLPWSTTIAPGPVESVAAPVGLAALLFAFGSLWRRSSQEHFVRLEERKRLIEDQWRAVEAGRIELSQARDEALRASKTKSRFVAMTSHELRGPINGILGMSHALRDTRLSSSQRDLVDALSTSAESLAKLLQDLLDLSKIEAGHLDIVPRPYEPRELVADVIDQLAHAAGAKGLEVAASTAADVPPALMGDAGRLRQILVNLVGNAIKFTSEGSVTLRARRAGEHVIFDVVDTGEGISTADIEKIFAPFEQVSAELVDRRAGSGLGLWISRSIADLMQGRLEVTSTPQHGSTFSVVLPLVPGQAEPDALLALPGPLPLLLVVGASPVSAAALCDAAAELGAEAHAVADVAQALAMPCERVKVIVLDIDGSAGEATLGALEQRLPGSRLMLAASSRNIARADAIARPIDAGVLLKPPRATRLASAITQAMGRGSHDPSRSIDITLNGTILVVDDDAINRKVASYAAEQLGLAAEEATDAESALRAIAERSPDIVLLDLHLEGLDGVEIARRIAERWPPGERPVMIACTGSTNEADRRRCIEAGMQEVLAKPLERAAFAAAVSRALRQRSRRSNPGTTQPVAVVDTAVYTKLRRTVGNALALEILSEFLAGLDGRFEALAAASKARDKARLVFAAHASASVMATFGAMALGAALRQLENTAKDLSWSAIDAQLEAIGRLRVDSEAVLRKLQASSIEEAGGEAPAPGRDKRASKAPERAGG